MNKFNKEQISEHRKSTELKNYKKYIFKNADNSDNYSKLQTPDMINISQTPRSY